MNEPKVLCDFETIHKLCENDDVLTGSLRRYYESRCNISRHKYYNNLINIDVWPFTQIRRKHRKKTCNILNTFTKNDLKKMNMTMSDVATLSEMSVRVEDVPMTEFNGTMIQGIYSMMYLIKKHNKICTMIDCMSDMLDDAVDDITNSKNLIWENVSLVWSRNIIDGNFELSVPGDSIPKYIQKLKKTYQNGKRFIISLLIHG